MTATVAATVDKKSERRLAQKKARQRFMRAMFSRRIVLFGAAGTLFFVLVALLAPLVSPHDPNEIDMLNKFAALSAEHLLGTDFYGRDLLSRLIYGTRVSILTGVLSTLFAAVIGVFIGMLAAFYGGAVDKLIVAGCDTFSAIPGTAPAMALLAVIGGGMFNMAIIICISIYNVYNCAV